MKNRFQNSNNQISGNRVKDISIILPRIRSEFLVRLYTLLNKNPEVSYEGYEFFIIDKLTGLEFSAGLTGFGLGYFCTDNSLQTMEIIDLFHNELFNGITEFKECKIEILHDFGKSILGFDGNSLIEIDEEDD
jgi:hypothetical protein